MELCNGEVDRLAVTKITDQVGAGLTYKNQCITCARFAGAGSVGAGDMQNFVSVKFIASTDEIVLCVNRLQK